MFVGYTVGGVPASHIPVGRHPSANHFDVCARSVLHRVQREAWISRLWRVYSGSGCIDPDRGMEGFESGTAANMIGRCDGWVSQPARLFI